MHYQGYLDAHEGFIENRIKAILIINHQRNKPVYIREPINNKQIELAVRNKSIIVETLTLLRMFEKYKNEELTTAECLRMFSENTGLLTLI